MRSRFIVSAKVVALGIILALAGEVLLAGGVAATEIPTRPRTPVYPLKASANNRYLVDQNNVPFMIVGDSPTSSTDPANSDTAPVIAGPASANKVSGILDSL